MDGKQIRSFKFRRDVDFGSIAAENDKFLKNCFLDTGDLSILLDTTDPKRVILGRTGTGKTALLEEIKQRGFNAITIDPEALSLQYLSNSTILFYLRTLGIHLDLFYKLLWKHIFAVELIKRHYKLEDEQSQKAFLSGMFSRFGSNKKKRKAIEYLVEWSESFWESTEYRVKEITERLEDKVKSEAGFDIRRVFAKGSAESDVSTESKTEIIHKAQTAVNNIQINELNDLMNLMQNDIFTDPQKNYYVLIDDLDKDWVDQSIVYELIRTLVEVVYEFSHSLKNVKIIIALRENILERIFRAETKRSPQREKFESLYLRLFWTKEQLIELLELRLRQIITGTYSNRILPTVKDILPPKSKSKSDGMTYILERTFMRPRDVIHYFNICVQSSVGRTSFNWDIIRTAELQYSQSRLESLQYEWQENYPGLNNIFKTFHGQSNPFYLKDFENDKIISLLQREMDNPKADWLNRLMRQYVEQGEIALSSIKLGLIIVLFQTGFLGIKPSPQDCVVYSFLPFASIVSEDLSSDTLLEIHPTFHRALGVKSEY